MRKMTGILAAIFTFSLGVTIYFIFLNFALDKTKPLVEPVESSSLPLISLCDATKNPKLFESDNIRVRARLSGSDGYGYKISSARGNCRAEITFRLTEKSKVESEPVFERLTAQYPKDSGASAEVEIVGQLIEYPDLDVSHYKERFEIKAKEIKQIPPGKRPSLIEHLSRRER